MLDDTDRRSQRERMLAGDPYVASDPELQRASRRAQELTERYNRTSVNEPAAREAILRELLGSVGDGVEIRPPFACDYGAQIRIGARTFANFNLVALDVAPITIGDNVWLGGGVIVCPGVTIGANTGVGAGPGVVRDLPADVVAVGNPARVIRSLAPQGS
jgi:maltose O-acetyltransferase